MDRFSHNCTGSATGVRPRLPTIINVTLRMESNFREHPQLCKHMVLVLVVEAKKSAVA